MTGWRLDWPTSAGGRVASGRLKAAPDDFIVDELLVLPQSNPDVGAGETAGRGEHLCLKLEKVGDNTDYVARELASIAGCRHFDVGFCGLKDRHAVTRQWFSLYRPGDEARDATLIQEIGARWRVLSVARQARKLRRGEHRANGFIVTLRGVIGDRDVIEKALNCLAGTGAPNYFGPQRFGIGGGNLSRAVDLDPAALNRRSRSGGKGRGGKKRAGGDGSKNVLYFSAARSWLFNEVLAARVDDGSWSEPQATGPLWGDGGTGASGSLADFERDIVGRTPQLERLFSATRMKPERRPLTVKPDNLLWRWLNDDSLELSFFLSPGQYATTILSDIFELEDMSLSRHNEQQG